MQVLLTGIRRIDEMVHIQVLVTTSYQHYLETYNPQRHYHKKASVSAEVLEPEAILLGAQADGWDDFWRIL